MDYEMDSKMKILSDTSILAPLLASFILMLMCIHHLYQCVSRRLWLFPCYPAAPFISLNAGTLALLAFSFRPPYHGVSSVDDMTAYQQVFYLPYTLMGSVLASAMIGACIPSVATADRSQIWSNVAGAALLLMTLISNILYLEIYTNDEESRMLAPLIIIIICVCLNILVLIVQACNSDVMISEVAACVSIRLQQLEIIDPKSISETGHLYWMSWEDLERRTYIKLMMALTSNLQNVASRSPSSAILAMSFLVTAAAFILFSLRPYDRMVIFIYSLYIPFLSALVLGSICISRWLRPAIHDSRPLRSLLFDTHPFYQHQKVIDIWVHLKDGPPRPLQPASIWQLTTFTLKSIIYFMSALIMLSSIIPMHWILLVCIRSTHATTTLSVRLLKLTSLRMLTWLPMKALFRCLNHMLQKCASKSPALADSAPPYECLDAGVIHITGEDPDTVRKLFAASAKLVIQRQIRKAAIKSTIALETLLKFSNQACFFECNVVNEVLDDRGIPDVSMLQAGCHYGDQYGWSLTALSLLVVMSKVEVAALGTSKTTMATMEAYQQAMQMVEVVDEMHRPLICSKEKYWKVSASLWSSLLNESRYIIQLVEHIQFLMAEVLAACLCSLPAVLETRTRRAVCNGHVAEIENAVLLVRQAGKIWKKLQWPQCKVALLGAVEDVPAPGFPLNQYWLRRRRTAARS